MPETNLSESNVKLLCALLKDPASQGIKYNWKQIAEDMGYANAKTANTIWGSLKKKILDSDPSGGAPKTPSKRKNDGDGNGEAGNEASEADADVATPTPSKKRKQTAGNGRKNTQAGADVKLEDEAV